MNDSLKAKILSPDITSYDLIKSFAVIIMVIDHLGYYFFPDQMWFRAVGRVGFPVWFFLVGYSSGRDVPLKLLGGALILTLFNFIVGLPLFPMNALVTIIIIRLTIDYLMNPVMEGKASIWAVSLLLVMLIIPTYIFSEYGSQAMITAIFGYLVRHRERLRDPRIVKNYMVFALVTFVGVQWLIFHFSWPQMAVVVIGTMTIRMMLFNFKGRSYPDLTMKLPGFAKESLQFMGRRTLEIYVGHLALFKLIALCMGDERFSPFRFALGLS